jgi:Zn-dependent M28 family amino/carboxypeptidase
MATWTEAIREQVSVARLRQLVETLPAPRNRYYAPEAMEETERRLQEEFSETGLPVERRPYKVPEVLRWAIAQRIGRAAPFPARGCNLVARLEGEEREAVVVGAHFDTVSETRGADDNGSGLAAMLELARVLAGMRFRRSVLFVAFDMEELDLIGSSILVPRLTRERDVRAALIFECLAYHDPSPGAQRLPPELEVLYPEQVERIRRRSMAADFNLVLYRRNSLWMARSFAEALTHLSGSDSTVLLRDPTDQPVLGTVLRQRLDFLHHLTRSDHLPFWEAGVPAIMVTDTADFRNPNYHTPKDTPDTLDYGRLAEIVAASACLLARVAGLRMRGSSAE